MTPPSPSAAKRPQVVIIGAGFAGLAATRALKDAPVDITVIDRRNFHLFQPLLYQVATASLSPADIAAPIRSILRDQPNARVVLGKVVGIDRANRTVHTEGDRSIGYDHLVIATGARHSYFGKDGWADDAPGIKTIDDATRVRAKILGALEEAELEQDEEARAALLTFVVVGAGPTGVEMAGAIAELVRKSASKDFRTIMPDSATVYLVEGGPRILAGFSEDLSAAAQVALEGMGVTVLTNTRVSDLTAERVVAGARVIPTRTAIWAAGVQASPAGRWLDVKTDQAGRVKVEKDFSLPDDPEIFVVGDTAAYVQEDGSMLPGVAPVAKQAGHWVGKALRARLTGSQKPRPFKYDDAGAMATIGRKFAIVNLGRLRFSGFFAWIVWSVVHVWFLIGFRNRLLVSLSWLWSYVTYERGARLITGQELALVNPPVVAQSQAKGAS